MSVRFNIKTHGSTSSDNVTITADDVTTRPLGHVSPVSDVSRTSNSSGMAEIADDNDEDIDSRNVSHVTSKALRKCKNSVIRPYWNLLIFIGWRRFGMESIKCECAWKIPNAIYPTYLILVILYSYSYAMVSSQLAKEDKYDMAEIIPINTTTLPEVKVIHATLSTGQNCTLYVNRYKRNFRMCSVNIVYEEPDNTTEEIMEKDEGFLRILSTHLFMDTLHFIMYLMGFYYFRLQEYEQMYSLMEKRAENVTITIPEAQIINTTLSTDQNCTLYIDYYKNKFRRCSVNILYYEEKEPENATELNLQKDEAFTRLISTHVIMDSLHFMTFLVGFYYFRLQENEQMYALMEKVFLQASSSGGMSSSQKSVIFRLRLFLGLSSIWLITATVETVIFPFAFPFPSVHDCPHAQGCYLRRFLLVFLVYSVIVDNLIVLAVALNFVVQCEMIIFYAKGVEQRFQERATELNDAMKDIYELRQYVSALNGPIAKMTSIVCLLSGGLSIIVTIQLALYPIVSPIPIVFRALMLLIHFVAMILPILQAARANSICERVTKLGLEARVFGYKTASQLELDSFLMFQITTPIQIRVFNLPITSTRLISVTCIVGYVFLVLFQTNIIGTSI